MRQKLAVLKAQILFKVAKFIGTQHKSPWKRRLASLAARINIARHGKDSLGFLYDNTSIDHMDFEGIDEQGIDVEDINVERNDHKRE